MWGPYPGAIFESVRAPGWSGGAERNARARVTLRGEEVGDEARMCGRIRGARGDGADRAHPAARGPGLRLGLDGRGLRLRRDHAARLHRGPHEADPAGDGRDPGRRAHADDDGDAARDPRCAGRRGPRDRRPRSLGSADRRGLVWHAVGKPEGAAARLRHDHEEDLRPRRSGRPMPARRSGFPTTVPAIRGWASR